MVGTYEHISRLSEDDLKRLHDAQLSDRGVKYISTAMVAQNFVREEIARRRAEDQTARIVRMTSHMRFLTVVIAVLTLVNVAAVVVSLLK